MLWLITDGHIHLRIEAENPKMAFEIAAKTMDCKRAQAHEVTYRDGVECMGMVWHKWDGSGAIPVIQDAQLAYSDPSWTDRHPFTEPFTPAPLDPAKTVMIMGYGISRPLSVSWRKKYPGCEIWTLNADRIPGATRHFQIHNPKICPDVPQREFELDDLKNIIVYRHDNFPFDKIRRNFLCSTADYMLAIADMEGFGVVGLPGMDFAGMRRALEMHSARYWVGVLEGKGAIVLRSPMSMMFRHITYGQHTEQEHYDYEVEPDARPAGNQNPKTPVGK